MKFLTLVDRADVVLKSDKFQFAQSTVDFAGVRISQFIVEPYLSTLMQSKDSQPLLILQVYEAGSVRSTR